MKVLLADDDAMSRTLLKRILEESKHEVSTAKDGDDAWEKIQKEDFELAILDWMMPGVNGPTICNRVRQKETEVPIYVIMLTSRKSSSDIALGLRAGADDYLCKPFDTKELEARIQAAGRTIDRIGVLKRALSNANKLRGHLPICGCCKKIKDDAGLWNQVESYLRNHASTKFEHAICPDCLRKGRGQVGEREIPVLALPSS
mgnify:CR=1 FL=1